MPPHLAGPRIAPASAQPPRRLVVILHGYGADGADIIDLGQRWSAVLPDALFVAPNAPAPARDNPAGYQWFGFDRLDPTARPAGAAAADAVLRPYLAELWAETGLGPHDTFLTGFSQGAMMSLYAGLNLTQPLRGIVGFSGLLIPPPALSGGRSPRPPICLVHGDADDVVPVSGSLEAADLLRAEGFAVDLHLSRGVGHGIAPDGLDFAATFLSAHSD